MFLAVLIWAVNQLARLGEPVVMRFPSQTDTDAFDALDR